MPVRLRIGPYRIGFFAADHDEPPHVHVKRERMHAKVWLNPIRLGKNKGFAPHEMRKILEMIEVYRTTLLREWHEYFGR